MNENLVATKGKKRTHAKLPFSPKPRHPLSPKSLCYNPAISSSQALLNFPHSFITSTTALNTSHLSPYLINPYKQTFMATHISVRSGLENRKFLQHLVTT
ncbi:unnamed protein product [Dovyalis caffra]|uniref:Uncharacterized protein n=1 Tax=Dovyalis caffra TaxID=77055 RepID=A0AAV1SKK2_9ROSI|nr:unnamed protein product [Dovyalis caffra]